jgi:hypothetical protein
MIIKTLIVINCAFTYMCISHFLQTSTPMATTLLDRIALEVISLCGYKGMTYHDGTHHQFFANISCPFGHC